MDPIRAVQCRLKFRSESSKSRVRLQSGSGRPAITSLFYKFRSLFTMIVKSGGALARIDNRAEIKSISRTFAGREIAQSNAMSAYDEQNDDDRG